MLLTVSTIAQDLTKETVSEEEAKKLYPQKVRNIIKTNPLMIVWGSMPFTSEYRIMNEVVTGKRQSSQIGFSYFNKSILFYMIPDTAKGGQQISNILIEGFRFQLQHKFYIGRRLAPKGFYLSPHTSYSSVKIATRQTNQIFIRAVEYSFNCLAGIQLIGGKFAFDMFAGLGYKKYVWLEVYRPSTVRPIKKPNLPLANSPLKITFGFNMGIAF